jgi:hypothetical protein
MLTPKGKIACTCYRIFDELAECKEELTLWNEGDSEVYSFITEIDNVLETAKKIAEKYDVKEIETPIIHDDNILYVNDTVMWSGGFGNDPYKPAKIISIDFCKKGEKYGDEVQEIEWNKVKEHAVVTLDNGHWAYGSQIKRM